MLRAEQVALEQAAYQQLLHIREKELNYFVNNCTSIGTQVALLAGFTITTLVELSNKVPDGWLTVLFNISASIALISGLQCVLSTTFVRVWGPGLALRGPKGSMVRAVDGMMKEQDAIFTSFGVCIVAFTMLGISTSWLVMQVEAAVVSTFVFVGGSYLAYEHCRRIYNRFKIPKEFPVANWESSHSSSTHSQQALNNSISHHTSLQQTAWAEHKPPKWRLFGRNKHQQQLDEVQSEMEYQPPPPLPETEISMEGYLTKKGLDRAISTWNRRYFVLQGQSLIYYRTRQDYLNKLRPIKSRPIDLAGYDVVAETDPAQATGPLAFSLRPVDEDDERRVWDFQCDTLEEYVQWTKALRTATSLYDIEE